MYFNTVRAKQVIGCFLKIIHCHEKKSLVVVSQSVDPELLVVVVVRHR